MRQILSKQFHLITLDFKNANQISMVQPLYTKKYGYVREPIRKFQNDFEPIQARSNEGILRCSGIHLWNIMVFTWVVKSVLL